MLRAMRSAIVLALVFVGSNAQAQTPPASSSRSAPATTADAGTVANAHAPTPFQVAINRGVEAYRRREYDAAVTAFREAAGVDARSALPQLYLGYVANARGDAATALGAYREALRLAIAANDDLNHARALAAIAAAQESATRWSDARTAWQESSAFGDTHAQVSQPVIGRSRVEAIGRRETLAQEYQPVHDRIEERLRVNASGQNQQAPAGTTPATTTPATGTRTPGR
jgi:tetratricopeptide (TPR) repeat protein